jgi:hypothetical protein
MFLLPFSRILRSKAKFKWAIERCPAILIALQFSFHARVSVD